MIQYPTTYEAYKRGQWRYRYSHPVYLENPCAACGADICRHLEAGSYIKSPF